MRFIERHLWSQCEWPTDSGNRKKKLYKELQWQQKTWWNLLRCWGLWNGRSVAIRSALLSFCPLAFLEISRDKKKSQNKSYKWWFTCILGGMWLNFRSGCSSSSVCTVMLTLAYTQVHNLLSWDQHLSMATCFWCALRAFTSVPLKKYHIQGSDTYQAPGLFISPEGEQTSLTVIDYNCDLQNWFRSVLRNR